MSESSSSLNSIEKSSPVKEKKNQVVSPTAESPKRRKSVDELKQELSQVSTNRGRGRQGEGFGRLVSLTDNLSF